MHKADIYLKRPKKARVDEHRRGPILPGEQPEYLSRRKTGIYLNFWDMGQINTGTVESPIWTENTPSYVPVHTYVSTAPAGLNHTVAAPDWPTISAGLLGIEPDLDNWEHTFRKLTYEEAEKYDIEFRFGGVSYPAARIGSRDLLGTSNPITTTTWETGGLKVPPGASVMELRCVRGFYALRLDGIRHRVTTTPDGSAGTEVDFTLDNSCKIFLAPVVYLWVGHSDLFQGILGGSTSLQDILDWIYKAMPRDVFLENTVLTDYWGGQPPFCAANASAVPSQTHIPSTAPLAVRNVVADVARTMDGARLNLVEIHATNAPPTSTIVSDMILPPTDFPANGLPPGDFSGSPNITFSNGQTLTQDGLAAVIKKGTQIYYVWGKAPNFFAGTSLSVQV